MTNFSANKTITDKHVRDLLCNAFEGGSNYWYEDASPVFGPGVSMDDVSLGGRLQPKKDDGTEDYCHWIELLPTVEGCAVTVRADGAGMKPGDVYTLDRANIQTGINVMMEKYPRHFANWMAENDDAETGDVFLQCCLFGEIVFG